MKKIIILTILLFVFGAMISTATAKTANPAETSNSNRRFAYPPKAKPYGVSQTEWQVRWWQWTFGIPADRNPINDTTGEFCGEDQSGPVYFLSSAFLIPGGTFVRNCTIPSNKSVYLPVTGTFCSPLTDGTMTPEETAECAESTVDGATNVAVQIDGQEVTWQNHRFQTGAFDAWAPDGNILEPYFPPGGFLIEDIIGDFYSLMLPPLSVGGHTIHVYGEYEQFPGFFFDITYNLEIVPAKGSFD